MFMKSEQVKLNFCAIFLNKNQLQCEFSKIFNRAKTFSVLKPV